RRLGGHSAAERVSELRMGAVCRRTHEHANRANAVWLGLRNRISGGFVAFVVIRWGITLPNGVRRSVRGSQRMLYRFHHVFISHKYGSPLMEAVRLYIQDAPLSIAGLAASLFHDKCQGVALIHQPEFPFGMRHRGWVEKDAALD